MMRRGRDGCKEEEPKAKIEGECKEIKAYLRWDAKLENQRDSLVCQLTPLDTEYKSTRTISLSYHHTSEEKKIICILPLIKISIFNLSLAQNRGDEGLPSVINKS